MNILTISRIKSFLKGVSWRIIGTIDTIIIAYVITGNPIKSFSIGGIEVFTKIILYYIHERAWLKIPDSYFYFKSEKKKGESNIYPDYNWLVSRSERERALNQKGRVIWLTGLSGSGKTTIAKNLEKKLFEEGKICRVLDGDLLRTGLNSNLGFLEEDRYENIRRVAEVAKILVDSGIIVIVSLITPKESMRELARNIIGEEDFKLVFVDTPIEVCEARDVKGLYAKARRGEIKNFTGVGADFETPLNYNICINSEKSLMESILELEDYLTYLK